MTKNKKKEQTKTLAEIEQLYADYEESIDFNSINEEHKDSKFFGLYTGKIRDFETKYGKTIQYLFTKPSDGSKWSLLSKSEGLDMISAFMKFNQNVVVYLHNEKYWKMLPTDK